MKVINTWQDEEALRRYTLIAPLLDPDIDNGKRISLRHKIAEDNGTTVRSLYRYEKAFKDFSFGGLKPQPREKHRSQKLPANFDELVTEAIQLRREVPERSVEQIIFILELEHRVAPGVLKRSTLERHLYAAGFGREHLRIYKDARQSSSKRFCKPHRMMLLQGDIKYGPKLPIGKKGTKVQTYLSSAIDDHSRYVVESRFYANQEETIVHDTFHNVVLKAGKFDRCYFDNGKQYVAKQLKFSLARLGIRITHAPVQSGKSKGKIEKFHQIVDAFLNEFKLEKDQTLDNLNQKWTLYLEEYYHNAPHSGIAEYYECMGSPAPENGITPLQEWNRDTRPLTFIDVNTVSEAFLYHEMRHVDKGACLSFNGEKFETKAALIGRDVEISYDPAKPEILTVRFPGIEPFYARPLKIGAYCDEKQTLPISIQLAEVNSSRLLDGLEKRRIENKKVIADALSFENYGKEAF